MIAWILVGVLGVLCLAVSAFLVWFFAGLELWR